MSQQPLMANPTKSSLRGNPLDNAFARLPRPQKVLVPGKVIVPTRSTLIQAAEVANSRNNARSPLLPAPSSDIPLKRHQRFPVAPISPILEHADTVEDATIQSSELSTLGPVITLGTLIQNDVKWALRAQQGRSGLIMVKRTKEVDGLAERHIIGTLNHRNVAKLVHSSMDEDGILCLAIEYSRYTLAEILFVHLKLEEQQVQYIARSVRFTLAISDPSEIYFRSSGH
jgi:hypothetical protein